MEVDFPTFVNRIYESRLMQREQLAAFWQSLPPESRVEDVAALGRELIAADLLTSYQVGRILHGRHQGLVLGKNVLQQRIGEGGMGRVYKAEHQTMKRVVAVKVISEKALANARSRARFLMEVRAAAKLLHKNIVAAHDADEQDGVPYLVMEFVDGMNLRHLVQDNGPTSFPIAIGYVRQVAEGLSYAHSQKVIHRDIKPSNMLLDKSGCVKILDMGLAQINTPEEVASSAAIDQMTTDKHIVGTVEYMSPEQTGDTAEIDERSDIYSLGCSLYFLLSGKPPFHRSTPLKTMEAHQKDPIPQLSTSVPDVSNQAQRLFETMVAKNPDDRYQTAQELIEAIDSLRFDSEFDVFDEEDEDQDTETFDAGELADLVMGGAEAAGMKAAGVKAAADGPDPTDNGFRFDNLKEHAVGIDLGTTFSAVSYLDHTGRPVTLPNAEGEMITPSVLLMEGGEVIVGKEAVKSMTTDMPLIAECAKRDLGSALFHKKFDGKRYRPEVLLAYILLKLRRDAEAQIGPIKRAVITVPAYFDEIRRKATQDAGYLAGLEVLDIINEPTAAAVAYGYQQSTLQAQSEDSRQFFAHPQRVLVYDLGGGTFDLTIMDIRRDLYRTMATDGDVQLGGRDWDERLVNFVSDTFLEKTGGDPRLDANTLGRLVRECEDAKRTLSSRQKATVSFEFEGKALKLTISRQVFEQLTHDLLARTEFTTRQTLKEAGLNWNRINRILMVGGSTRMPAVAEMLERISGIKPDRSVAPDEAVAHGAAIRAGMLLLQRQGDAMPIKIINVNSHTLGVVGANPRTGQKQAGVVIPRNTPLPASAERVFRTIKPNQQSILVRIVEGESANPDDCADVGKCIVHNLPKNLPERTPVIVRFQYDENGRLTVMVKVSGMELKQQILRENMLNSEQLERWRKKLAGDEESTAQPA